MWMRLSVQSLVLYICLVASVATGFQSIQVARTAPPKRSFISLLSISSDAADSLAAILTSRLPTSVDDQVRQAAASLKRANEDGKHRHSIRLLLPIIGATDLDDWPGGARQMMEAANPLVEQIVRSMNGDNSGAGASVIQTDNVMLDPADGVYAIMVQAAAARDDSGTVLLPSADNLAAVKDLEKQVGPQRNLLLVNSQWKRRSDFGGNSLSFFGGGGKAAADEDVAFVDRFAPTFSLTNFICDGDSIRVLRSYPGPWRVFMRTEDADTGMVDWNQIGSKDVVDLDDKSVNWDDLPENQRDGGRLFDYGQPTYQEILAMLIASPGFKVKSPAERAAAAFIFIKDTL
jgi:hypothetical protein